MSDCQKCIHEDVCDQASRQMWSRMNGETNCSDFKDRAKYAEVRHGRWIDRGDYVTTAYGSLDLKICSECNAEVTLDGYDYYCPNCGAKMDGGADA